MLGLAVALAGCVPTLLARKVVAPPNKSGVDAMFEDSPIVRAGPSAFSGQWMVDAGPPRARISVASIEPADYRFQYDLAIEYAERRVPHISRFTAHWLPAAEAKRRAEPPRGTVLLLHGYLQDKRFVVPWAVKLAEAGYRCAVVDLRGHGESTGKHISFGAFESADISAVIDDLGKRGWDVSRVGLFGISYGASVALLTAGRDARVRAVVAFEPFASAERAVPELMRAAFAAEARGITDRQFAAAHVKEAAIAGFHWSAADVPAALARTTAPVLFLHGEADTWLSPEHSRELFARAPAGSELKLVKNGNHVTLPLELEAFASDVLRWFGKPSNH